MRKLRQWVILILVFALALAGAWFWGFSSARKTQATDEAVVLVEQVKAVSKLIAIEATVSEIYEHTDFWGYDLAPFRKKALVRVKAKVSVGYDLENMVILTDEASRTITIRYPDSPQILSIDQELDYYDLSEGWLNSFDEKALSDLQSKARTFIEQKVRSSDLFDRAEDQKETWLKGLENIVSLAGWTMIIQDSPSRPTFRG